MDRTKNRVVVQEVGQNSDNKNTADFSKTIRLPQRFKSLANLVWRDLNEYTARPYFHKYKKQDILRFMEDPYAHEKELREACIDMYGSSTNFRRLIQYFASLTDLSYVIVPTVLEGHRQDKTIRADMKKVMKQMEKFQVKSQFRKILTVCFREDVFYGTMWVTADSITIQQLPPDYCKISSIEGNVFNVDFDFSYFSTYPNRLKFYPQEFALKYQIYKSDPSNNRWITLDCPKSFAIKCANEIGDYALPPLVGILPEIYDLDGYKQMKLTRTELENYAILVMKLGINADGSWVIDFDKARDFWQNLDSVLPDAVGSVLSPMDVEKISFERATNPQGNSISQAMESLFASAGVSSLLFSSDKASSNTLLLSIKADQVITYGVVQSIADMVNRYIQSLNYGKNFKVTFLDVSPFNRDEVGSQYLKMCNVGMPMVSYLAAAYGMSQLEMDNMNYLEDVLLGIKDRFRPLQSSSTMSSSDADTAERGRPQASMQELSDGGQITRERDEGD